MWGRDTGLDSHFCTWMSNFSSTICWKDYLCSIVLLNIFMWVYFWALCSVPLISLSILSPNYSVLIIVALYQVLKSGSYHPPTLFSFSIGLAILGVFLLHIKFRIRLSISTTRWDFDWDHIDSLDQVGKNRHLDSIESFCSWTWNVSPFI